MLTLIGTIRSLPSEDGAVQAETGSLPLGFAICPRLQPWCHGCGGWRGRAAPPSLFLTGPSRGRRARGTKEREGWDHILRPTNTLRVQPWCRDFTHTNAKGYERCQALAMALDLFNEPRKPI